MKIGNLKVGTRLAYGFAAVLILLVVIAWLGLSRLGMLEARLEQITQVTSVEATLAIGMRDTVNDRMIALRNIALLEARADMEPEVVRVQNNEKKYDQFRDQILAMFARLPSTSADEKAKMDDIAALDAQAAPVIAKAVKLGLDNQTAEATKVLLKELRPVQFKWAAALTAMVDHETKLNETAVAEAQVAYSHARTLMLVLAGFAIVAGGAIAWFITQGITRPISAAVKVAQTVAAGDLSSEIHVATTDETGQLLQALKDMNGNLEGIVKQVRSGTDTISTASSEIAAGNLDLSSRTEEQASSLEETASSMEEITSTVRQNADNARQANQLAAAASSVAVQGGAVVGKVITTMDSINASSRKIEEIISVIDGIAFQTNILALNAAVEAARAGEQGRGFAVVASEVRNLAHRSAAAAKEIKVLISDSVEQVSMGSRLVGEAGQTMEQIVVSVRQVTDIMGEITAASVEQTLGIEQVNQAISQMDTVTQQNAALVEQAAAAAGSLEDQAGNLSRVVSVFTLKSDAAKGPATFAAAPAAARRAAQSPRTALTLSPA